MSYKSIFCLIFTILFLPLTFFIIEDVNLIGAFGADDGSITHAIEYLLKNPFHMHGPYHSRFYGWSYYMFNVILLLPVKYVLIPLGLADKTFLYFGIRLILFAINLAACITFMNLIKRLFKSDLIAFVSTLVFVLFFAINGVTFMIHPEGFGVFFILLACFYLLAFIEKKEGKKYYYALVCMVIATLAKQQFFLISLVILYLFLYFWAEQKKITIRNLFRTKEFRKNLLKTIGIAFLMLLAIYPDAILRIDQFFYHQAYLSRSHGGGSFNLDANIAMIKGSMLLLIFFIFAPISIIVASRFKKSANKTLFITLTVATLILTVQTLIYNRLWIALHYYIPFAPFMIISLTASFIFLFKTKYGYFWKVLFGYLFVLFFFISGKNIISSIKDRYDYQNNAIVKAREYILQNISIESKIAHDSTIALPTTYTGGCHVWSCDINAIKPDFAFIQEKGLYAENLKEYIKDSKMKLKDKICVKGTCILIYEK